MNASGYEVDVLTKMLFKNTNKVHSSQNDNNSHLGLVMLAAQYAARTGGVAYVVSLTHPGMYDPNIAANSRRMIQSHREDKHKQLIEDHIIEKAVLQVSKNQLDKALAKWLLSKIEDHCISLNTVSLQDIFNHAYNYKGQIDNDLVDEYMSKFNAPTD
eukprot:3830908-Ditylum_brightwellii.AAC.1